MELDENLVKFYRILQYMKKIFSRGNPAEFFFFLFSNWQHNLYSSLSPQASLQIG